MKFLYNQVFSEEYINPQSQRLNVFQVEGNAVSFIYGRYWNNIIYYKNLRKIFVLYLYIYIINM